MPKQQTQKLVAIEPVTLAKTGKRYAVYIPARYMSTIEFEKYTKSALDQSGKELAMILFVVPKGHANMAIEDRVKSLLSGE